MHRIRQNTFKAPHRRLGAFERILSLSPTNIELLTKAILGFLSIGSFSLLVYHFRNHRKLQNACGQVHVHPSASSVHGRNILLCWLVILTLFSKSTVLAYEYQVEGEVSYKSFDVKTGTPMWVQTNRFIVAVTGDAWTIRTIPVVAHPGDSITEYSETSWDGKELRLLQKLSSSYDYLSASQRYLEQIQGDMAKVPTNSAEWKELQRSKIATLQTIKIRGTNSSRGNLGANDAVGVVSYQAIPQFRSDLVAPLWFAFASGKFLDTATNGYLPYIWQPANNSNGVPATVQRLSGTVGLPSQAVFYNLRKTNAEPRIRAMYATEDVERVGEISAPRKFAVFTTRGPQTNSITNLWIGGKVTRFQNSVQIPALDAPATRIAISDLRFREAEPRSPISYHATSFMAVAEFTNTETFKKKLAGITALQKGSRSTRRVPIYVLLGVILAVPLVAVGVRAAVSRIYYNKQPKTN